MWTCGFTLIHHFVQLFRWPCRKNVFAFVGLYKASTMHMVAGLTDVTSRRALAWRNECMGTGRWLILLSWEFWLEFVCILPISMEILVTPLLLCKFISVDKVVWYSKRVAILFVRSTCIGFWVNTMLKWAICEVQTKNTGIKWFFVYQTGQLMRQPCFQEDENVLTKFGSVQVSGDAPTLPWVGFRVWVGAGLGLGLAVREGWVDTCPESWVHRGMPREIPAHEK